VQLRSAGSRKDLEELMNAFREQSFESLGDLVYFDTPTQGVPPASATGALREAIRLWESGRADWRLWEEDAEAARSTVASILGCPITNLALIPSVVGAAATVAVQAPPGRFVVADREYRSNLLPWLAQRRFGREVIVLSGDDLSRQLEGAIDDDTALIAISSVQSDNGDRVDLARVIRAARQSRALVFIDATQSLGVVTLGVDADQVDFIAAAGYKWLLGARGTGYFYVRPELQSSFEPVLASTRSAADVEDGRYYGEPFIPFADARRFDQSQAWLSWVAARPGLEMLAKIGTHKLEEHALGLSARFRSGCTEMGYGENLAATELSSPVVTLSTPDPKGVHRELSRQGVRAAVRPTGVRFGFHFYNDVSEVDRALDIISEYLKC
jgi:selenocysteine lyase/cysteine desulfurase